MPQFDDTNRGVLFKEKEKKTDKSPDYTGKLDVGGKPYRLAGWIKEGRNGKFLSLAIDPPKDRGTYSDNAQPVKPGYEAPPLSDEIPDF